MLGTSLIRLCRERDLVHYAYSHRELDITDAQAAEALLARFAATSPRGLVINAAALTGVDRAEDEPERAFAVNAQGAANLARAAAQHGLDLIHLSTDYVFDGSQRTPYRESDRPQPLNVYGRSKLAGEQAVSSLHPTALIVRTSWLFGHGRSNFPARILELALNPLPEDPGQPSPLGPELRAIRAISDQVSCPTSADALAKGLLELYRRGARGLFHLAGAGSASRYELAQEVLAAAGLQAEIIAIEGASFPARASRPLYSVLDCAKARGLGVELPRWQDTLHLYVQEHLTRHTLG